MQADCGLCRQRAGAVCCERERESYPHVWVMVVGVVWGSLARINKILEIV